MDENTIISLKGTHIDVYGVSNDLIIGYGIITLNLFKLLYKACTGENKAEIVKDTLLREMNKAIIIAREEIAKEEIAK